MFVFWQGQFNQSTLGCSLTPGSTDYWRFCYSHTENVSGGGGQGEKASFYRSHLHLNEVKQLQSFTLKTVFMKLPQGTLQQLDSRASFPTLKDREEFVTAWHWQKAMKTAASLVWMLSTGQGRGEGEDRKMSITSLARASAYKKAQAAQNWMGFQQVRSWGTQQVLPSARTASAYKNRDIGVTNGAGQHTINTG